MQIRNGRKYFDASDITAAADTPPAFGARITLADAAMHCGIPLPAAVDAVEGGSVTCADDDWRIDPADLALFKSQVLGGATPTNDLDDDDDQIEMRSAPLTITAGSARVPTFETEAYNGGPMKLDGWQHPVVVDLTGLELPTTPPIFLNHDEEQPLGHCTALDASGGALTARGLISYVGNHVDEVVESSKQNFPWQASIGASPKETEFVARGSSGFANGRNWPGPVNIVRRAKLREISFVPLGADDTTSVRIAARFIGYADAADTPMSADEAAEAMGLDPRALAALAAKAGIEASDGFTGSDVVTLMIAKQRQQYLAARRREDDPLGYLIGRAAELRGSPFDGPDKPAA